MRRFVWLVWCAVCALYLHVAAAQGTEAPSAKASEAAFAPAATPAPVWVNTHRHVHHFPGSRWYWRTEHGKYVSEADAIAEGDRAAINERRPLNFGTLAAPVAPVVAMATALPNPRAPPIAALAAPVPAAAAPVPLLPSTAITDITPVPEPTPAANALIPVTSKRTEQLFVCLTAIAAQSNPAKLSTLSTRAANPRLKRIMFYLAQARAGGADPGELIDQAQGSTTAPAHRALPWSKQACCETLRAAMASDC